MKSFFVEARRKFKDSDVDLTLLDCLHGKSISIASTIQYIDLIPKVKSYLESLGKRVIVKKGAHYDGHILGCNSSALDKTADEILIITDGKFHAINNAIQIQRPVYVFSGKTLEKVSQEEIESHNKKTLAKQKKFLFSKNVALILSTKYGQHYSQLNKIKILIEKMGKTAYIFECNNINSQEFDNFPQIQIWINSACFGIARDSSKIINLRDILKFLPLKKPSLEPQ